MHTHLQQAVEAIDAATAYLRVEQIAQPVAGKWSIAEILEHLTLTFTLNAGALEKALASGKSKSARPTIVQWVTRVLVLDLGYFPRARAPEAVVPRDTVSPERSREAARAALAKVDEVLDRAAGRFGEDTPLLRHAFFAGLTVPQWRKFHWRHTLHHVRQIRQRSAAQTSGTRPGTTAG